MEFCSVLYSVSFSGCSALTSISDYAFAGCTGLNGALARPPAQHTVGPPAGAR
jgi:hypothetical protein